MNKRLQVVLTLDAWNMVETITREVNENFEGGSVNFSDTINEMILNAKVDVKALQLKHTDLKKSLIALAKNPEIDVETVLKCISELKGKLFGRNRFLFNRRWCDVESSPTLCT